MALIIPPSIKAKLDVKHKVKPNEVVECFANFHGELMQDTRPGHETDPVTQWFIGETDYGRVLKVCFVLEDGDVYLKTAYEPNSNEIDYFNK